MGDYFRHWLEMGKRLTSPPKVFCVNWFRMDENGDFIWPGFGENIRVLKWAIDRVNGRAPARETPLGLVPHLEALEPSSLKVPKAKLEQLFGVDSEAWQVEMADVEKFYAQFGSRLPQEILRQLEELKKRLKAS
jgi:phosphoenolpyruvate carboxykinase (GTP)